MNGTINPFRKWSSIRIDDLFYSNQFMFPEYRRKFIESISNLESMISLRPVCSNMAIARAETSQTLVFDRFQPLQHHVVTFSFTARIVIESPDPSAVAISEIMENPGNHTISLKSGDKKQLILKENNRFLKVPNSHKIKWVNYFPLNNPIR